MTLQPPDQAERQTIIETICHLPGPTQLRYDAFLDFYISTCTNWRKNVFVAVNRPAFQTHKDVLQSVRILRSSGDLTRTAFQALAFPNCSVDDQNFACRAVAKVGFMIDCASKGHYSDTYRLVSNFPVKWEADQTFSNFAWKLKKRYEPKFVATNDLVQHLLFDRENSTIRIFHQTAYLKSQLRHTSHEALDRGLSESIKDGSLPPQLLLETIVSIHYILFPISVCEKSAEFAKKLIRNEQFDSNFVVDEGSIRSLPRDFECVYWADRLRIIRDITANPPARNRFVAWVERHTSERNALTVALIGLFLPALFGFLGVIIGLAQLAVSIVAWKYPAAAAT